MNKRESKVLSTLLAEPFVSRRTLSKITGHSLTGVDRSLKRLLHQGFIDEEIRPTMEAIEELNRRAPKRAIILASGPGLSEKEEKLDLPNALLQVDGERIIERQIEQLQDAGIQTYTLW